MAQYKGQLRLSDGNRAEGELHLSDGNRAAFLLTIGSDGKAITECGFLQEPTKQNIEEFEEAIQMLFEDLFGRIARLERTIAADNPETRRQQKEAYLRGGSSKN
jgi:hypothetical protein